MSGAWPFAGTAAAAADTGVALPSKKASRPPRPRTREIQEGPKLLPVKRVSGGWKGEGGGRGGIIISIVPDSPIIVYNTKSKNATISFGFGVMR